MFYGDRAIDRSPCGTGTSARLAHLAAQGKLKVGDQFVHESIIGSRFIGRVLQTVDLGGTPAIIPMIEGAAFTTGFNTLWIDPVRTFPFRVSSDISRGCPENLIRTMSGQITARIREKILTGVYPPGSALLQDVIAAEFGVSKIPVREALVQLRAEGLVDVFAHRGFQVRPLSSLEVDEVFRLRSQIEPLAVAEGARRAEAEDRDATRLAFGNLNDALAAGELYESGDLNRAFHIALIVPRLQPITAEILSRLHTLSQRYVRMHLLPPGRVKRATLEHTGLFEAWISNNNEAVMRLTLAHIETTRDDLAQLLPGS